MAVSRNAVAVPNADTQDALVVALTADGSAYLRADRLAIPDLVERVRTDLSTRNEKTLYIKADARFHMHASLRSSTRCKSRASKA
jgi:biopolymer transport protein ExbD/biopolymer transport protein TolR